MSLCVHVLVLDEVGRVWCGPDGAAPVTMLEPGESPIGAARRVVGLQARWLGTVHSGAGVSGSFVVLALASAHPLESETVDVPGGAWTLERARALDWHGEPPPETQTGTAGAERRQLTVLFCDLVGSTALSAQIDAEELRDRIAAFQRACSEVITRFHGFVARYMGDGLLAYFGYPQAWGDDAERAVRAGLAIQAAVLRLEDARVRVGIATGDVVVGDLLGTGSAQERVVVGETPNLAARLQALALPGEVLLAPSTAALVRYAFALEDAGTHQLKGLSVPVPVVRALRPARASRSRGPFVGRDRELALVREAWARGELVVVIGEAGVGKSRVVEALIDEAPESFRLQASAWHTGTALHPVLDALRVARDDGALGDLPTDGATLVQSLLADAPVPADRDEMLDRLTAVILRLAGRAPLVVLDDAQWADTATLAMVERIHRSGARVLGTQRPSAVPLGAWNTARRIELTPLDDVAVEAWLAGSGIEGRTRARIVERAGGNPLYVQELARLATSDGVEAIPVTLKDALTARLGRGTVRAVARSAAAFGGPFEPRHLESIHPGAEPLIVELARDGVLRRVDGGRFDFTHALLRDAAYETLLRRDRLQLHAKIADVLGDGDPEARAEHLGRAERFAEASVAWEAAARLSAQRFAPKEAEAAYGRALEAARGSGASGQRLLALGVARASHLRLLEDYAETTKALDQAEADAQGVGLVPELAQLWFHRGNLAFLSGETDACRAAHERALGLAVEGGFLEEQARAWSGLGDALYATGDMRAAYAAFRHCVALARERSLPDVVAANLPLVALMSFFLGDAEEADRVVRQALSNMTAGAHRGHLTAGATLAVSAHHRGVDARVEVEEALRRNVVGPIYSGFAAFSLSLVARTDDEAVGRVESGLALVGENRALGIKGALFARRAALTRDSASLTASLPFLVQPTPIFVRLFGLPHALHAARRIGDAGAAARITEQLDELGQRGAPYAERLAAWGRGSNDAQLDHAFPA